MVDSFIYSKGLLLANMRSEAALFRNRCEKQNMKLKYSSQWVFYTQVTATKKTVVLPKPDLITDTLMHALYKYGRAHEIGNNSNQCKDTYTSNINDYPQLYKEVFHCVNSYRSDHQYTPYRGEFEIKQVGRKIWNDALYFKQQAPKEKHNLLMLAVYYLDHRYRQQTNPFITNQTLGCTAKVLKNMVDDMASRVSYEEYNGMFTVGDVFNVVSKLLGMPTEPPSSSSGKDSTESKQDSGKDGDGKEGENGKEQADGKEGETKESNNNSNTSPYSGSLDKKTSKDIPKSISTIAMSSQDENILMNNCLVPAKHRQVEAVVKYVDAGGCKDTNKLVSDKYNIAKIHKLFTDRARTNRKYNKKEGLINKRALARVGVNRQDIFYTKEYQRNNGVAISILMDGSGSMQGDKLRQQVLSVYSFVKAFSRKSEVTIETGIFAGDELFYVTLFNDRITDHATSNRFSSLFARGGTLPEQPFFEMTRRLNARKEHTKIAFLFTDGCFSKFTLPELDRVTLVGVGIGVSIASFTNTGFKHCFSINNVQDLTNKMYDTLKGII